MWVSKIQLLNIKGFVNTEWIGLSKGINVIVGPNNAGKSTILKGLGTLQNPSATPFRIQSSDFRKGAPEGSLHFCLEGFDEGYKLVGIGRTMADRMTHLSITFPNNQMKIAAVMDNGPTE